MLLAFVALLVHGSAIAAAAGNGPPHVLLLHSFGRDVAPYDTISSVFRTRLAEALSGRVVVHEASLDTDMRDAERDRTFVDYLKARFDKERPNVVVTIGPAAARFYVTHRDELFPEVPLVLSAVDERIGTRMALRAGDAGVFGKVDLPALIENIFALLPETTTIAVVAGASNLERFWVEELKRELARYGNRAKFVWLDALPLDKTREQVARLPANSAILYTLLVVDAAGIPHERQEALTSLHAAANAPIFGIYENELGKGVVGGPYSSQRRRGEQIAAATVNALAGKASDKPALSAYGFEPPVYDGRELARWNIDPSRLPAGSEVRFVPPSAWQEHRVAISAGIAVLILQTALIASLLWQRARRRHAEGEAHSLGGRLITAHEDERRRIARELHDDVTQRLAGLAIEAAKIERGAGAPGVGPSAHSMREGLVGLSEDVHALSYRLHPSVIEDLGLVEALRAECDRVARNEPIKVALDAQAVPEKLPADAALCLYRVAQEALRNVARHAKARSVEVSLRSVGNALVVTVHDDGDGFDQARTRERASLGIESMRERVRLLGGDFEIDGAPGRGTTVVARVPLRKAA